MEKSLRYVKQNQYQKIEHDLVITRIGEFNIRLIESLTRGLIVKSDGLDAVIFDGLYASPGTGLSIDFSVPAVAVQKLPNGDVRYCIDSNSGNAFNVILDPSDPTFPRRDIIEAQFGIRDKNLDTAVDIADPVTKLISTVSRYRDKEIYMKFQKNTGIASGSPVPPSPTAATYGELLGTVTTDILDLSTNYILSIAIGDDTEFVDVDCRGATPSATTRVERIAAINGAGFGSIAANIGGAIKIICPTTTGEPSVVKIKQPNLYTADGYAVILGGTITNGYYYEYRGSNNWFKIAEMLITPGSTTISPTFIYSREEKDTDWLADANTIENAIQYDSHRTSVPMDHKNQSVEDYHLAPSALAAAGGIFAYGVKTQADFNNLFERVSANNYKVKDVIKHIVIDPGGGDGIADSNRLISAGSYKISGILTGGDLPANGPMIDLNNCIIFEGKPGTVIDWDCDNASILATNYAIKISNHETMIRNIKFVGDANCFAINSADPTTTAGTSVKTISNFIYVNVAKGESKRLYNGSIRDVVIQGIGFCYNVISGVSNEYSITDLNNVSVVNCNPQGNTSEKTVFNSCTGKNIYSILNGRTMILDFSFNIFNNCTKISNVKSFYDQYGNGGTGFHNLYYTIFKNSNFLSNIRIERSHRSLIQITASASNAIVLFDTCNKLSGIEIIDCIFSGIDYGEGSYINGFKDCNFIDHVEIIRFAHSLDSFKSPSNSIFNNCNDIDDVNIDTAFSNADVDCSTNPNNTISGFLNCDRLNNIYINDFCENVNVSGGSPAIFAASIFNTCRWVDSVYAENIFANNDDLCIGAYNCRHCDDVRLLFDECGDITGFLTGNQFTACYFSYTGAGGVGNTANFYGFDTCNNLTNCRSTGDNHTKGISSCYKDCNYMSSCYAAAYIAAATRHGYESCAYVSSSRAAAFGSPDWVTCSKVDNDSCNYTS